MAVSGSSGAAAAAAAAAAARAAAEAARKAAEEAARRAAQEAAKKAAEAAQKKAQQAAAQARQQQQKAAAAQQQAKQQQAALQKQQAQLKKAQPKEKPELEKKVETQQKQFEAADKKARAETEKANRAQIDAINKAEEASRATKAANDDAIARGQKPPFKNVVDPIRDTFEKTNKVEGFDAKYGNNASAKDLDAAVKGAKTLADQAKAQQQNVAEAQDPKVKKGLNGLGVDPATFNASSAKEQDNYLKAARQANQGNYDKSIEALSKNGPVATDAINRAAKNLPKGPERDVLTNPDATARLLDSGKAGEKAVNAFANGKLEEGLKAAGKAPEARDAVIDTVAADPKIKKGLEKAGLTADDLKAAGDGAGALVDGAQKAAKGNWAGAIRSFADAGSNDAAAKAIGNAAQKLPNGPAKDILKDPNAVKALLAGGKDGEKAVDALAKKNANLDQALKSVEDDPKARDAIAKAVFADKDEAANLKKMGIDSPAELSQKGGPAFSELLKAGETDDPKKQLSALTAAAKADPGNALVRDGIVASAGELPDSQSGARGALTDPRAVQELISNPDNMKALDKITSGDLAGGLRELNGNPALRSQVVNAAAKDPVFKEGLDKLGLSPDEIVKSGKGMDEIVGAAEKAKTDPQGAVELLSKAAKGDPAAAKLVEKSLPTLAAELPDGPEKRMLQNKQFVQDLVNSKGTTEDTIKNLAEGNYRAAYETLKDNPKLQKEYLQNAVKDPQISVGLEKAGIIDPAASPAEQLKQLEKAKDATGDVLAFGEAAGADPSRWRSALKYLGAAGQENKAFAEKAIQNYIKDPPPPGPGMRRLGEPLPEPNIPNTAEGRQLKAVLGNDKALDGLLTKSPEAYDKIASGDIKGGLQQAEKQSLDVRNQVIDSLKDSPDFTDGLKKLGLTPTDLKSQKAGVGELYQATQDAQLENQGDSFKKTLQDLRGAAQKGAVGPAVSGLQQFAGEALKTEGTDGADTNKAALRSLFENKNFATQLLTNDKLKGAFDQLTSGDLVNGLNSAGGVSEATAKSAINAIEEDPTIKKGFDSLGITPDDLLRGRTQLGNLVAAGAAAGNDQPLAAIGFLAKAFTSDPKSVPRKMIEDAIKKGAGQLDPDGATGVMRDLLTNDGTLKTLLDNGGAIDKLSKGDLGGGLKDILTDEGISSKAKEGIANAVLKNDAAKKFLGKLGIDTPQELIDAGDFAGDLVQVGADLGAKDWQGALGHLKAAYDNMPADMKDVLVDKLAESIPGAPDGLSDVLKSGMELLDNKAFTDKLGDAITSLTSKTPPDVVGFVKNLGGAALIFGETDAGKDLEEKFLNSLGKMDGPVGDFFSSEDLNHALAQSGAVNDVFEAVGDLASGDIGGAVGKLGGLLGDLAGWPEDDHLSVAGVDLPFSKQGIEAVGMLFGQFVKALPDSVQNKIEAKAAEVAGKSFVKSIPLVGNIISGVDVVQDVGPFVDAIKSGDGLDIALKGGQLAVDLAGTIPGLGSLATPLKVVVGTANAVNDVVNAKESIDEIRGGFSEAYG